MTRSLRRTLPPFHAVESRKKAIPPPALSAGRGILSDCHDGAAG